MGIFLDQELGFATCELAASDMGSVFALVLRENIINQDLSLHLESQKKK